MRGVMIAPFFGKLAATTSGRGQANWSIRVPCPGGSGACAGGAELESSASLSLLGGGALGGLLLTTGVTGGVAETLEILMGSES
jgi:hypothetical protein